MTVTPDQIAELRRRHAAAVRARAQVEGRRDEIARQQAVLQTRLAEYGVDSAEALEALVAANQVQLSEELAAAEAALRHAEEALR